MSWDVIHRTGLCGCENEESNSQAYFVLLFTAGTTINQTFAMCQALCGFSIRICIYNYSYICVCVFVFRHVRLCSPMDSSPPDSSVHRIFLARLLEWVAISFSNVNPCFHVTIKWRYVSRFKITGSNWHVFEKCKILFCSWRKKELILSLIVWEKAYCTNAFPTS